MSSRTHYSVLNVLPSASDEEVNRAFRLLVRKYHPDLVGDSGTDMMIDLNRAHSVLASPTRRRTYDASLIVPRAARPAAPRAAQAASAARPTSTKHVQAPGIGVGPRAFFIALGSFVALGELAITAVLDEPAFTILALSVLSGTLMFFRRTVWAGGLLTGLMVAAASSVLTDLPLMSSSVASGIAAATVGWVGAAFAAASLRKLRTRHADARAWNTVLANAGRTNTRPLWVLRVEGRHALLEEWGTGVQRTIHVWGTTVEGTWVSVADFETITASAPASGPMAAKWVREDAAARAGL